MIYLDKSDAKNKLASATSLGVPPLLRGIPLRHSCTSSSESFAVISVSINQGAITLLLMFLDPSSKATDFEKPIIPAFEAA